MSAMQCHGATLYLTCLPSQRGHHVVGQAQMSCRPLTCVTGCMSVSIKIPIATIPEIISTTGDQPGRCSCTQGAHVGIMRVKIHRPINSSASLAYCMSFPGLADAGTTTNELAASTCWAAIFNILVHRFPH
jgi:hypothetical protein